MASVSKRTIRWTTKDGQEQTGERWQAHYRDEHGLQHRRLFKRKMDAQRWLDETTAAIVTGNYVDPRAGKTTFARFYAEWSKRQVWVPSTRENADHVAESVPFAETADEVDSALSHRSLGESDEYDLGTHDDQDAACHRPVSVPRRRR